MHPITRLACLAVLVITWGCAMRPATLEIQGVDRRLAPGDIIDTRTRRPVTLDELVAALDRVPVVYVGEQHTDSAHHRVQATLITALQDRHPGLQVGMEMFDVTYQDVLNQWSAGDLSYADFLEKTHWYANWQYPDRLYRDLLELVRDRKIPLIALNIPFDIPPKIATGGLESLQPRDRPFLPDRIDTTNADHRAYVKKIFDFHRIPGRTNFDYFYAAQCAWEDAMAQAVSRHASVERPMVVLAGSGHIRYGYGIPDRARRRSGLDYRTIVPVTVGEKVDPAIADYIWATPTPPRESARRHPMGQ